MNKKVTVGVDCGGTNLKLVLAEPSGKIAHFESSPIGFKQAPRTVVLEIAGRVKNFIKKHKIKNVKGIGMGIAGDVDSVNGVVRFSPNLNWKNVSVKKELQKELRVPVIVDNDANCAAWGAYSLDAKKDCSHLVCITLGTGVGSGLILNKKLYRGATGTAGEVGHMTIQFNGRACKCGNLGCLESMVGAWGLIQTAEEGLKKGLAPILKHNLKNGRKELTPKMIASSALEGDSYCQQLWRDAGEMLGSALSNCVNILNPDRIVLCGGVSKVGSLILEPALHSLGKRAFSIPAQKVKVTLSKFDERLGVVGAALLFWE